MAQLNLSSLIVASKQVETEYPGLLGFKVNTAYLSREELVKIRKKATKTVFKNRQATEELNDDLFLSLYVQSVVKGWTGLKLRYLEKLVPVDLSGQKDLDTELEFSEENALMLMKNSTDFDAFISETVSDIGNFQQNSGNS